MTKITAFLAGLLFGIGLIISGMSNPEKVTHFLDLAGNWDPSLGLVMAGAIIIGLPGFSLAKKLTRSLLNQPMQLPTSTTIDRRLVIGSLLFGVGWGLAGICPGPALVLAMSFTPKAVLFMASMLAGMAIFKFWLGDKK